MASKSDMRHGPSAESADFASTDQAHFRSQLWAGIWTRYKLTLSHLSLCFVLHNVNPKLGEITLLYNQLFPRIREQKIFGNTFNIVFDMYLPPLTIIGYPTQVRSEYNKIEFSSFFLLSNMSHIGERLGPFARSFSKLAL